MTLSGFLKLLKCVKVRVYILNFIQHVSNWYPVLANIRTFSKPSVLLTPAYLDNNWIYTRKLDGTVIKIVTT